MPAFLLIGLDADLRFRAIERGEKVLDLDFFGWSKEIHVWPLEVAVVERCAGHNVPALDAEDVQFCFVERDEYRLFVISVAVHTETVAHRPVLPRAEDEKASLADCGQVFFALDFDWLKFIFFKFTHRFFLFSYEIPREMIEACSPTHSSTNPRRKK